MKTFFVVNPKSANGATGRRWAELAASIARTLSDFGVEFTKGPLDAVHITRSAIKSGYDCIVACGGDGTINEVVNGFFEDGKVLNPNAALGVLPRGTGGDFRKTFDWDLDSDAAIRRLKTPDTRPFDVGRLDFLGHDGKQQTRYFANICSFGVSGLVDLEVNRTSKALGGTVSFMLGSLKAMTKYKDQRVRLTLDDKPLEEVMVTTLSVANGKYFGGGMKVAPDADVSDGLFDVVIWSGYGLTDFVVRSKSIYSGAHVKWKGTRIVRAKKVVAESDEKVLIDCDGEQPGLLPCTMTILPSAIRLKV
ncbi:MAG: diacylglycerol kinase family lipid kinase [Archangium sp.]|nr:diacylglycerol kinase family lipid kinase [Archangium sp.]